MALIIVKTLQNVKDDSVRQQGKFSHH